MKQETPRLSARALIYRDNHLLLTKYQDDRGFWYVTPGGGINKGESVSKGLQRELFEELGAKAIVGDLVAVREVTSLPVDEPYLPPNFHQVEMFFFCELESITGDASESDPGQIGFEWVACAELETKLLFPEYFKPHFASKQFEKIYYGNIR